MIGVRTLLRCLLCRRQSRQLLPSDRYRLATTAVAEAMRLRSSFEPLAGDDLLKREFGLRVEREALTQLRRIVLEDDDE